MQSTHVEAIRPNWQKFALLVCALGIMLALVLANKAAWSDVSGPFGIIVGYGAANGIGAARGQSPAPLFVPTNPRRRVGDSTEVPVIAAVEVDTVELTPEQHRAAERARRRAASPERTPDD